MLANSNIVSGGAKFQCADFKGGGIFSSRRRRGGQDFSAPESEHSTAPLVALNNDHSPTYVNNFSSTVHFPRLQFLII